MNQPAEKTLLQLQQLNSLLRATVQSEPFLAQQISQSIQENYEKGLLQQTSPQQRKLTVESIFHMHTMERNDQGFLFYDFSQSPLNLLELRCSIVENIDQYEHFPQLYVILLSFNQSITQQNKGHSHPINYQATLSYIEELFAAYTADTQTVNLLFL